MTAGILEQTCLNTNDIIHETIAMVRSNAEAQHVRITLDLAASPPLVSGDRIQVRQVLLNLMRNVFEAMHQVEDGSRVLTLLSLLVEMRYTPDHTPFLQEWTAMCMPRAPKSTVGFVDQHCAYYRDVFPEVRSFEYFTALHLGLLAELPRKTLPAIARAVGVDDAQAFHHFFDVFSLGSGDIPPETARDSDQALHKRAGFYFVY